MTNTLDKYYKWTIIREIEPRVYASGKKRIVICRCECGKEKEIALSALKNGGTKSCGCSINRKRDKRTTSETPIPKLDLEKINKKDLGEWTILYEVSVKRDSNFKIVRVVKAKCSCGYEKEVTLVNAYNSNRCPKCAIKQRTKEELISVANIIRKTMFDFYMGKIGKKKFLKVYWEFEGFLLKHGYVEQDNYFKSGLSNIERFLKKQYNLEDIKKAIDFNKYHTDYGNIIGGKSDEEIEAFINSL